MGDAVQAWFDEPGGRRVGVDSSGPDSNRPALLLLLELAKNRINPFGG